MKKGMITTVLGKFVGNGIVQDDGTMVSCFSYGIDYSRVLYRRGYYQLKSSMIENSNPITSVDDDFMIVMNWIFLD